MIRSYWNNAKQWNNICGLDNSRIIEMFAWNLSAAVKCMHCIAQEPMARVLFACKTICPFAMGCFKGNLYCTEMWVAWFSPVSVLKSLIQNRYRSENYGSIYLFQVSDLENVKSIGSAWQPGEQWKPLYYLSTGFFKGLLSDFCDIN